MARQPWIITISGDRPIHDVARDLQAAGLELGNVNDLIGSLSGFSDAQLKEKLTAVPGVADVSPDTDVHIAPPDSPVQ